MSDDNTYIHLSDRILELEIKLATNNQKNISTQLEDVRHLINASIESQAELKTLNRITTELKLWETNKSQTKSSVTEENMQQKEGVTSKEYMILAKYPVIKEAYSNLSRLSSLDVPQLVNYIEKSRDKTHDFAADLETVYDAEDDMKQLSADFHTLVVKNLFVLERYMALMVKENEFWTNIETRVAALQRLANVKEEKLHRDNKY